MKSRAPSSTCTTSSVSMAGDLTMPMPVKSRDSSTAQFTAALEALVPQLQGDRSILAALLGGSLSHDRVWEKSDIDLLLVTVDDKLVGPSWISLNADGVNVHAQLMQRAEFR